MKTWNPIQIISFAIAILTIAFGINYFVTTKRVIVIFDGYTQLCDTNDYEQIIFNEPVSMRVSKYDSIEDKLFDIIKTSNNIYCDSFKIDTIIIPQ